MDATLDNAEYSSVKRSFYNIFSLFNKEEHLRNHFHDCISKWRVQLNIPEEEFELNVNNADLRFKAPTSKIAAIEQIYDLVYMVYLDDIVEDIELEAVTIYAQRLGLNKCIVGDLLKAIVTAPHDGLPKSQVRTELKEFLELT